MAASNGSVTNDLDEFRFSSDMTLEDIRANQQQFCRERNFRQYHTPRNILLALVGEVGELAKIFQWKGEVQAGLPECTEDEKKHIGEEISDVLIYLVDLASQCHIDLPAALYSKMQMNAKKYPPICTTNVSQQKFSVYGENRSIVGTSVPERAREEGDGSE